MKSYPAALRGFSMIEVLVTIVIVAFGLLGLASLVFKGLQAGADSRNRTMAVKQTYDMADRMRANVTGVLAHGYENVTPSTSCGTLLAAIAADGSGNPIVSPVSSTPQCSGTGATYDTNCWQLANSQLLPNGTGAVCKSSSDNWYAIFVSWNEDRAASGNNRTFWIIFEP